MNVYYTLMHKNDRVMALSIDEERRYITNLKLIEPFLAPYLGNADLRRMNQWIRNRSIPGTREGIHELLASAGVEGKEEYLLPDKTSIYSFLSESGVPDKMSTSIAENYATKLEMLHEYQHGKVISLYHEQKHNQYTAKKKDLDMNELSLKNTRHKDLDATINRRPNLNSQEEWER